MSATLKVDGLRFVLRRSARRRTVGITVDRGGELIVTAPTAAPRERIEELIRSKLLWVYEKLARKRQLLSEAMKLRYVPGESHLYLGRRYRILLVGKEAGVSLRFAHGRFELQRKRRRTAAKLFRDWYAARARERLGATADSFTQRVGAQAGRIEVRDLGFRWGSCSRGVVYFHWRVMQLAPRLIEYVVAHELVHLRVHQHSPAFWRMLERVMPDAVERKEELANVERR